MQLDLLHILRYLIPSLIVLLLINFIWFDNENKILFLKLELFVMMIISRAVQLIFRRQV